MPVVGTDAALWAVMCNDTGTSYTVESWITASNLSVARHPDFGGYWKENACLYWGAPSVLRPPQSAAARAGGILMLQSRFDPWTPRESAYRSLEVLPNASLIEVTTEFSHGLVVPYGDDCIDRPVAEYFLTGRQPPRRSECEGRRLPADLDAVVRYGF